MLDLFHGLHVICPGTDQGDCRQDGQRTRARKPSGSFAVENQLLTPLVQVIDERSEFESSLTTMDVRTRKVGVSRFRLPKFEGLCSRALWYGKLVTEGRLDQNGHIDHNL